jgi:hypothetical protein
LVQFIEDKKKGLTRKIGRGSMSTLGGFSEADSHDWFDQIVVVVEEWRWKRICGISKSMKEMSKKEGRRPFHRGTA